MVSRTYENGNCHSALRSVKHARSLQTNRELFQQVHMSPARQIRWLSILGVTVLSSPAAAQMPGAPVLQNAWRSPGLVVAADFAGGSGSLYGGAVGWAP